MVPAPPRVGSGVAPFIPYIRFLRNGFRETSGTNGHSRSPYLLAVFPYWDLESTAAPQRHRNYHEENAGSVVDFVSVGL